MMQVQYLWDSYRVRVAFLENYDIDLSHLMISGVDVWLNTPKRYQEASGTSGMKTSINGVPNFSVLDGWWIEGYEMDNLAGWKIGPAPDDPHPTEDNWDRESAEIYSTLDTEIIPLYYSDRSGWVNRMKHAVKLAPISIHTAWFTSTPPRVTCSKGNPVGNLSLYSE